VNGAAYGKGIYLSPIAGTSFGYSRMYGGGGSKKAEVRSNSYIHRLLHSPTTQTSLVSCNICYTVEHSKEELSFITEVYIYMYM
jgi:hypothetical protein